MSDLIETLRRTARLEELGVAIRSPELASEAKKLRDFYERGGNRAMRRAAAKAGKRK